MKQSTVNNILEAIQNFLLIFAHDENLVLYYDRLAKKCEALPECDIYDDREDAILRAKILADDKNQYVEIPQTSRFDTFNLMEKFANNKGNINLIEALFSKHPMAQFNFQVEAEGLKDEWEMFVNDLEERDLKEWAIYWNIIDCSDYN